MEPEEARAGQRIKVNLPGVGDHGQLGTIKQVKGRMCYVHLDRAQRLQRVTTLFAQDLELVATEPQTGQKA